MFHKGWVGRPMGLKAEDSKASSPRTCVNPFLFSAQSMFKQISQIGSCSKVACLRWLGCKIDEGVLTQWSVLRIRIPHDWSSSEATRKATNKTNEATHKEHMKCISQRGLLPT